MINALKQHSKHFNNIANELMSDYRQAAKSKDCTENELDRLLAARDLWKRAADHITRAIACIEDAESRIKSTGKFKSKVVEQSASAD